MKEFIIFTTSNSDFEVDFLHFVKPLTNHYLNQWQRLRLKSQNIRNGRERFNFFIEFSIDFFSIWVFFHNHSRITGLQGKGKGISLTPHYHFHPTLRN